VVQIRPFLNSDVPNLVELWHRQEACEGRISRITPAMLETHVFARSYFDPSGLLVAEQDHDLVGASLCGFAPTPDGAGLDQRAGILSLLLIDADSSVETSRRLWAAAQEYFARRGCQTVYFGSRFPDSPFLNGFCGGTFVPGVTTADHVQLNRLASFGFQPGESIEVLKLDLPGYRLPIDRRVVMAKRQYEVRLSLDPLPPNWWQNNVLAFRHHLDFRIVQRKSNQICGRLSVCNTLPQDSGWDSRFFGIIRIEIDSALQRAGLGQAMLSDAIKDLEQRGVEQLEAQVPRSNAACHSMLTKIGFLPWYSAIQMRATRPG
jgi:GNAT superfamily N-acetyltransferase